MVSTLALTAAPLDALPRPVLAMALVRAFWNELLAPATVLVEAVGVPGPDAELAAPAALIVLVGVVEVVVAVVLVAVPVVLPVPVVPAVPELDVDKLVVCVPLAAPAAVLM
jgi:hypothetical protein